MITNLHFEIDKLGNYMEFVPYIITMDELYNAQTLYQGYDPEDSSTFDTCYDQRVLAHYYDTGKHTSNPLEHMARAVHDHCMTRELNRFLERYDKKSVVAVMGGNAMKRTDEAYRKIVIISKTLTEQGYLMVSGGGSGAMEATALGGLLAGRTMKDVDDALKMLSVAPNYKSKGYFKTAFSVLERYPHLDDYECLTIPTWLYGHEPSTPFATHIAKFFDNSIREDTLLTIAYGGIIFTPGSAGTMQEIFQEAVQNHYLTLGFASPMVFLDTHFWTEEIPVYPLLENLLRKEKYNNLLLNLTDSTDDVIRILGEFHSEKTE